MHSLAPKNWFQNDIEIQIRHVSPPVIEFVRMQLAYRHDGRSGESYEALDGKRKKDWQSFLASSTDCMHLPAAKGTCSFDPDRNVVCKRVSPGWRLRQI